MPPAKRKAVSRADSGMLIPVGGTGILGQENRGQFKGWVIGNGVSPEQLKEMYFYYPTARVLDIYPSACWTAGIRRKDNTPVELEPKVLFEMEQWSLYKDLFGWSPTVFEPGGKEPQAWNPLCDSTGAEVPISSVTGKQSFDRFGFPSLLNIHTGDGMPTPVNKADFYIQRTRAGLPGFRGAPALLPIITLILTGNKILEEYTYHGALHAQRQIAIQDKTAQTQADLTETKDKFLAGLGNNVVVFGEGIDPTMIKELATMGGNWDPVPMLGYIDKMVCRSMKLGMSVLDGNVEGASNALSSQTSFFAYVKQYQDHTWMQTRDALIRCGAPSDWRFCDPAELPAAQKATLLKDVTAALLAAGASPKGILKMFESELDMKLPAAKIPTAVAMNTGGTTPNPNNPPRVQTTPKEEQGE